ncbi:MAG: hypothetical protein ABIF71_03440 [Planctomycetota bacterium]
MQRMARLIVLCVLAAAGAAWGEVVELVDGTRMSGTIVHAYGNAIELKGEGGEVLVLHLDKVRAIAFTRVQPRPEPASPEKTFAYYTEQVRQGKIVETIGCFRLMYQKMMAEQIAGMREADRAQMQEEMVKTDYVIGEAAVTGLTAKLKVTRKAGGEEEAAEIPFVKEEGEWRMAMMLMPDEPQAAPADNVEITLQDGTLFKGGLIHVYGERYEVRATAGEVVEFDRANLKSITVIHAAPQPQFGMPEKTFGYYLSLMKQGKVEETVECYRLMLQTVIAAQVAGMSAQDKVAVQEETGKTKFEYGQAVITGDTAVLRVTRVSGTQSEGADVIFVNENGEWKLSMPADGGAAE